MPPLHTPQSSYAPTQSSSQSHKPSWSASSGHGKSTQSPTIDPNSSPSSSDKTTSIIHASYESIVTNKLVNTPEPAGITSPVNENPSTRFDSPTATLNPASAAAPPDALRTCGPSIANWNPPIFNGES